MYGAAVWLVWVLALQTSAASVAAALAAFVLFALAAWLWTGTRGLSGQRRGIGAFATVLAFGVVREARADGGPAQTEIDDAIARGAELYLTGELRHHDMP